MENRDDSIEILDDVLIRDVEEQKGLSEVELINQTVKLRDKFTLRIFNFAVFYCILAILILILQGFKIYNFHLHHGILMALTGSITITSIGLFLSIVKGIYK